MEYYYDYKIYILLEFERILRLHLQSVTSDINKARLCHPGLHIIVVEVNQAVKA